ncbi:MAG: low temperature requirement protein A [Acidimicrobiia bacterium]
MSPGTSSTGVVTLFRRYFWKPPRAHGEVIEDRSVSFLELFYDLVYVVVIARAAHTLAEHVSWRGAADFAVVFGLIWIAWLNGTMYHDLHGREDGRTRTFVFVQMALLALLAVFTSEATGADGTPFALTYAAFFLVLTWLWYSVRRQDSEEHSSITGPYLAGMITSIVVIGVSAVLPNDARVVAWAIVVVGSMVGWLLLTRFRIEGTDLGTSPTGSLVERFGLFTIIVLGEVVVGVVEGISDSGRTALSITTGMIGLMIGFAFWWTYFDFVGDRHPRSNGGARTRWMFGHLPATMSIAATGAAMVSLVEHAADDRAPEATAWLLAGSVALGLVALVVIVRALDAFDRLPGVYQPVSWALATAAVASLVVGWLRPAPWLLAFALYAILTAVWLFAIAKWVRVGDPNEHVPGTD